MKRILNLVAILAMLCCFASCYDDSKVLDRIDNLDGRLTELENEVAEINTNLGALKTVIEAYGADERITKIEDVKDEAGNVIGYTITFSKSGVITIYHGKDGSNGVNGTDGSTPTIGISLSEGVNYWTVNGDFLMVDGQKVPAYILPQVKVSEDNMMEISFDNGVTWQVVGPMSNGATGSGIFTDVKDEENCVTFYFADGREPITIAKGQAFALEIAADNTMGVKAGGQLCMSYTIVGGDENTVVDGFIDGGYTLEFISFDARNGQIFVNVPSPITNAKAFIFAVNGKGVTSSRIIYFEEGILTISSQADIVPAEGGVFTAEITSNVMYDIMVSPVYPWVTLAETKAAISRTVTFNIAANESTEQRVAQIMVMDQNGLLDTPQIIMITQEGKSPDDNGNQGGNTGGDVTLTNSDDFNTFNGGKRKTMLGTATSESGWTAKKSCVATTVDYANLPSDVAVCPALNEGNGVLTSPALTGGLGRLQFSYGTHRQMNKGIYFNIVVKNEEGTAVFEDSVSIPTAELTQTNPTPVMTYSKDINVEGTFTIEISHTDGNAYEMMPLRLCIFNLGWSNYTK